MDPKENLDKTIEEVTAEEVVAEASKVGAAEEMVAVKDDTVSADKLKKKGKGMVIGMVFLALFAAGGIGFGVWAYLTKNQESETLNNQITTLKDQNSDLLDKLGEEGDETTIIDIDTESAVDTADYIYIGEWGLKIKIPKELKWVGYQYLTDNNEAACKKIDVTGAIAKEGQVPDFVRTITNYEISFQGSVTRCPKNVDVRYYSDSFSLNDEYNYYYHIKQSALSEKQRDWDTESVDLIQKMLTNTENYSKI